MAGEIDGDGEVQIIVSPSEIIQETVSGDLFSLVLSSYGYRVVKSAIINGKAILLAKNPLDIAVTFLLDPIAREIQIMHTMPLLYRVSANDVGLARMIMDISLQTKRVSILLDRDMREVVLMTAIDLLGSPSFDEIINSIENRWSEIEEIRGSGIVGFVDATKSSDLIREEL